jgi:hypothetical protein
MDAHDFMLFYNHGEYLNSVAIVRPRWTALFTPYCISPRPLPTDVPLRLSSFQYNCHDRRRL